MRRPVPGPTSPGGRTGSRSPPKKPADRAKPQLRQGGLIFPCCGDERGLSGRDLWGPRDKYPSNEDAHMKSSKVITEAAKCANYATIKRFHYLSFSFYSPGHSAPFPHLAAPAGSPSKCWGGGGIEDKEQAFPLFNWRSKVGRRAYPSRAGREAVLWRLRPSEEGVGVRKECRAGS